MGGAKLRPAVGQSRGLVRGSRRAVQGGWYKSSMFAWLILTCAVGVAPWKRSAGDRRGPVPMKRAACRRFYAKSGNKAREWLRLRQKHRRRSAMRTYLLCRWYLAAAFGLAHSVAPQSACASSRANAAGTTGAESERQRAARVPGRRASSRTAFMFGPSAIGNQATRRGRERRLRFADRPDSYRRWRRKRGPRTAAARRKFGRFPTACWSMRPACCG